MNAKFVVPNPELPEFNIETKDRTFFLCATSQEELNVWKEKLEQNTIAACDDPESNCKN